MHLLIVDDHPVVSIALHTIALEQSGFEHVEIAGSAAEARRIFDQQPIEALWLDLGLPDQDGFTVAEYALARRPATHIFIFSGRINERTVAHATRLRLSGFVDKGAPPDELFEALRALRRGATHFSAEVLREKAYWQANPCAFDKRLSDTERRVMDLIIRGYTDAEIAGAMGIAPKTAETHRGKIMHRLDVHGTPKLIACATARGFGTLR